MMGSLEMCCIYFEYGFPLTYEDQRVLLFVKIKRKENENKV
jgi:hypothetical protein